MKGTTTPSTPDDSDSASDAEASPRYAIRFESNVTRFAELSAASDQARFTMLEAASGVVLEQIFLDHGIPVPVGDEPFRCETIAATLAHHGREASDEQTEIPEFPEFSPKASFSSWVYDNVAAEDLLEISTILGTNTARTYRQLSAAMTIVYGLPRFAARARRGEYTQAHLDVVSQLCLTVSFKFLPELDAFLMSRRADVTCETLRRALSTKISLLVPTKDMTEIAAKRRRVDVEGNKDGSATMFISGPSAEIFSCFDRIDAMARAINGKKLSSFNLPAGTEVTDDRSIDQLKYDLIIRPVPELSVKVRSVDPITGILTTHEHSLFDTEGELLKGADSDEGLEALAKDFAGQTPAARNRGADCNNPAGLDNFTGGDGSAGRGDAVGPSSSASANRDDSAFLPTSTGGTPKGGVGPVEYWVKLRMPTSQWWLANQAATVATVPFLTLIGESDLPGALADGTPIPAEVARTIAGRSKTIQRILTDPASGTPVDSKATTYAVPKDLRKTLVEQWTVCTAPGCSRKAENAEIDHVIPFFHLAPMKGGLTRFGNLHPLCKKHHALKTASSYRATMPESGTVSYMFNHGISTSVSAPDQPINIAQALELEAVAQLRVKRWSLPKQMIPPPPMVLELMPGESTIRQRDEAARLAAEREARQLQLSREFEQKQAARKRLMLERALDWEHATFQLCLPPGEPVPQLKLLEPKSASERARARARAGNGLDDPWDCRFRGKSSGSRRVDWDHDLKNDPPPF